MDFLNATDPATLTASPQRVFKSRCYFCSSTNSCADHLPTAASTAVRTLNIAQTADSKPPTTAPTTPSRTSSICSPLRDGAASLLESSCLTYRRLESRSAGGVDRAVVDENVDTTCERTGPGEIPKCAKFIVECR